VTEGDSILQIEGIDNMTISGGPGNALCFEDSSIIAVRVPIFQGPFTTIEIFVKTCTSTICHGTIFSYSKQKTFSIRHYGTILVTYGDEEFDTKLALEDEKWNQISLVYDGRGTKRLDVYVFTSVGHIQRASGTLKGPNPFTPRGDLALGRWQPSTDGSGRQRVDNFKGCVDELRIWQR
jgi:hypothetical protein